MNFNGLQGLRRRHRLSETKLHLPSAPAKAAGPPILELELGIGMDRTPISWTCQSPPGKLSVQGPANSGKTSLLASMASQATEHLDVYAYLSGETNLSLGFKAQTNNPDGAIELLLDVGDSMKSALNQIQIYEDSFLTDAQRSSPSWMNLSALAGKAPPIWRPMSAIVFIDDFDSLCRDWITGGSHSRHQDGPYGLVEEIARDGATVGLSLVIAGRSLARSPIARPRFGGLGLDAKLLLGPSTLAERETFWNTGIPSLNVGQGVGLFEDGRGGVADVVFVGETLSNLSDAKPNA